MTMQKERLFPGKMERSVTGTQNLLDTLALCAVMNHAVFRFFQSTTFQFVYSDLYKTITLLLIAIAGSLRFVYTFFRETQKRKQMLKIVIFLILVSMPFFYVAWKQDFKVLVYLPLSVLCLWNIKAEKIFKWFAFAISVLLAATMICAMTGCMSNLSSRDAYGFSAAYGITNTTDFAAYFLFILLSFWCSCENQEWQERILFFSLTLIMAVGVFWLSGSRTTQICFYITAVCMILEWIGHILQKSGKKTMRLVRKAIVILATYAFPLCLLILLGMSYLYGKGIAWTNQINYLLSNRLSETWKLLQDYGLSLFGSNYTMTGFGGTMIGTLHTYNFPDSSYSFLLIRYGLMITGVFLAVWCCTTRNAFKQGKIRIALSMAVIAVYGITESHMVDVQYNMFLLIPLCAFCNLQEKEKATEKNRLCFNLLSVFTAVIPILFLGIAFPFLFSWLRTLFFLNGWDSGSRVAFALLLCMALLLLYFTLFRSVHQFMKKRNKRAMVMIVSCLICFVSFAIYSSHFISKGLQEYSDEIQSESEIIETILEKAKQPVYTYEKSELYRKKIAGLSFLPMSAEDLERKEEGSIITNRDRELPGLVYNWSTAKYVQLSDNIGIYSYDSAVINALESAGYEWKDYYNSERTCNLSDLAYLNGLSKTAEGIALDGPDHSISQSWSFDQWAGDYEARITLFIDPEQQGKICTFRLTGNKGEIILQEREIFSDEFTDSGSLSMIIPYSINSTPKCDFQIIAENGIQLIVQEIAWRRIL